MNALNEKAEKQMEHFKGMVEKLNSELIENKRLKEQHDHENRQKLEQQQARIAELHAQYRSALQNVNVLQGETEAIMEAMQQMKLQHTEAEIERERELELKLKDLDIRHQQEKEALFQEHEIQRKASQQKYDVKMEEVQHHSGPEALNAAKAAQQWELEKARRDREQKKTTERLLNILKKEIENDYMAREEKLKSEFELKVKETAEDGAYFESMVNTLHSKMSVANDRVQEVLKFSEECDIQTHWAFGKDPNDIYQPSKIVVHRVGDLSFDPEFQNCFWEFCLAKHELPPGLKKDPDEVDPRYSDAFLDATMFFMSETSAIQETYMKDPTFYPFRVVEEEGSKPAYLADSEVGMEPLIRKYGRPVAEAVRSVKKKLLDVNSSGDYAMSRLWNSKENRAATPIEIVEAMNKRGEELLQLVQDGGKPTRSTTRTTRSSARQSRGSSRRDRQLPVLA